MRYFLHLAYNGASFCGWQLQPNAPTVQENIETALRHLLKEKIDITGCGRTDTGVHAFDYYAHFDFREMSLEELSQLKLKLNRYFNHEINILGIYKMKEDAHARFDAISRTYKYYVAIEKQPFKNDISYYFHRPLNLKEMNKACERLITYTDFTSFSKSHTQVNNYNCNVALAYWEKEGDQLVFTIQANRFLRNMVRAIVGTLLEVGLGKIDVDGFCKVIESKSRCDAGISVPAKALFLYNVEYKKTIFL